MKTRIKEVITYTNGIETKREFFPQIREWGKWKALVSWGDDEYTFVSFEDKSEAQQYLLDYLNESGSEVVTTKTKYYKYPE